MLKFITFFLVALIAVSGLLFPVNGEAQSGATLALSPATGSFYVGSTFSVSIFANTGGNDINAVEVDLTFPPDKLQIVSPTAGESFISVWMLQPEFSNIDGTLSLVGGLPSPGINTSNGLVTTVTFRIRRPGEAIIQFKKSSKVLRNDGLGTNILTSLVGGRYTLLIPPPEGPVARSSTHPDKNTWYSDPDPTFSWTKDEGVNGFSYELGLNPQTVPDNVSEGVHTIKEYSDLGDGIWYFHIRAHKTVWGGTTHFPVFVDTTPPASFAPELISKIVKETQRGTVSFITTDGMSGLDHYELKIDDLSDMSKSNTTPAFFEVSSPYRLPTFRPGSYQITVRASDAAGNYIDESVVLEVVGASILEQFLFGDLRIWVIVLSIIVLVMIGILIFREVRRKKLVAYDPKRVMKEIGRTFDILEQDLLAKLGELEHAKTKRELNKKEQELHDKIIRDLNLKEDNLKHYFGEEHLEKTKKQKVKSRISLAISKEILINVFKLTIILVVGVAVYFILSRYIDNNAEKEEGFGKQIIVKNKKNVLNDVESPKDIREMLEEAGGENSSPESQDFKSSVLLRPQLKISDTPVDYLNVRNSPSLSGQRIGRVYPGEKYGYNRKENGWYEIILIDGNGWVFGKYVETIIE